MSDFKFTMMDLAKAESYASKTPNVWWDNYDLVIWTYNPSGWSKKNGKFYKGQWGTAKRVVVNNSGLWKVPSSVRNTR
jgi:hypothetical protein